MMWGKELSVEVVQFVICLSRSNNYRIFKYSPNPNRHDISKRDQEMTVDREVAYLIVRYTGSTLIILFHVEFTDLIASIFPPPQKEGIF